ncbi:hypothetical protein EIN_330790 [Entamoeba invadens IP1]|uniref:Leucine rich repeat containing protein BspA family protein n=1 Tax=Entamoeba invadens IP1 TaxID=370355 RepID=L7FMC6_ENTIV|nr:hypothetical protein EIN_330790 [Entamoeba invadens IP1]ELP88765.1 hypothetical protein EIN_330790 [Entamoeba invadens IP1]|eukprot:XP_004255536.1 hypothetical protein EIN_330790 [Entamoeba invadens IP1]
MNPFQQLFIILFIQLVSSNCVIEYDQVSNCVYTSSPLECSGDITIPSHCHCVKEKGFQKSKISTITFLSTDPVEVNKYAFDTSDLTKFVSTKISIIGEYAFQKCYFLSEISNIKTVTSIGQYAFLKCFLLTKFEFSDDLHDVGNYAFAGAALKKAKLSKLTTGGYEWHTNTSRLHLFW